MTAVCVTDVVWKSHADASTADIVGWSVAD